MVELMSLKSSLRHLTLVADCWHVLSLSSFNATMFVIKWDILEMGFGETRVLTSNSEDHGLVTSNNLQCTNVSVK